MLNMLQNKDGKSENLTLSVQKHHGDVQAQQSTSWWGCCRLLACAVNICMIVGMYLEYLWAAEWDELPTHCENRDNLPWLDFCNCFHRYTFSHAMLRGQNLQVFGVLGTCVAACFIAAEHRRTRKLECLLRAHLQHVSEGPAEDGADAASAAETQLALRLLPVYSVAISIACVGVLLLVPFHLERPLMHYTSVAVAASSMLLGMSTYAVMPLDRVVGLSGVISTGGASSRRANDDLFSWAERHQFVRRCAALVIAMHFILPTTLAVHHLNWFDATGRIFGACEVLTILSYQLFVAILASDDFASRRANIPQQS